MKTVSIRCCAFDSGDVAGCDTCVVGMRRRREEKGQDRGDVDGFRLDDAGADRYGGERGNRDRRGH